MVIRRATDSDAPFIAHAIWEADRSGTDKSSYATLFQLSHSGCIEVFQSLLDMELEDCEFSIAACCIVEVDGQRAATCAGWVEGAQEIPSWQMKFSALRYILSDSSMASFHALQDKVKGILPARTSGALQLEAVYIEAQYRGLGILQRMFDHQLEWNQTQMSTSSKLELMTYDNNLRAIQAYKKLGFDITNQTKLSDPEVADIYPSDGMVMMQK
ncbi:MAG: GNAT family N-acetyltransferase [Flavobacteriales bacterium]